MNWPCVYRPVTGLGGTCTCQLHLLKQANTAHMSSDCGHVPACARAHWVAFCTCRSSSMSWPDPPPPWCTLASRVSSFFISSPPFPCAIASCTRASSCDSLSLYFSSSCTASFRDVQVPEISLLCTVATNPLCLRVQLQELFEILLCTISGWLRSLAEQSRPGVVHSQTFYSSGALQFRVLHHDHKPKMATCETFPCAPSLLLRLARQQVIRSTFTRQTLALCKRVLGQT